MSVLKCKMCGGNVIFEPGATIGICDSCGTRQTLPRIDDDRKNLLLDRANHFRRNGEFDKASALFEQLINEGALDADIYWSLVLCKYGIQYVKDPATGRQVPTINRAQYTPVTSDGDYKQALSLADAYQRELYESEAHDIDEIQKGILAISQKEEPFDVFICYKETDDAGRRTKDSVLAQELYYELKERGFKVFFSRITLEDKLGEQYEPYIFAAINSAKVMVVLGTKPEYFNAVWVKNEWSRFLLLIKQGKKKMLIPAYRDMDPYELPEEFVTLQAQDMSKLGFVQDLVRGIEKITGANKAPVNNGMATPAQTLSQASNKTLSAMLDRGFLALEDGEFDKAAAFFEDALNIDARNARAYFGLSLVDFKKKTAQELAASTCVIGDNNNFKKALRFADAQAIEGLNKIVDATIANRKEQERADIYQRALNKLQQAKSNGDGDWYKEASVLFAQVQGYKSADELTEKCMTAAKNSWYAKGEKLMKQGVLNFHQDSFYDAIKSFSKCGEYKDVKEQVAKCQYEIAHIPAYLAAQKLIKDSKTWNNNSIPTLEKIVVALKKTAGYRDADKLLAEYEKLLFDAQQKKNNKKLHVKRFMVIGLPIIVVVTVLAILLATVFIPLAHYNTAKSAMEGGNYVKAYQEYSKANWKDSEEQAAIAQHNALSQALNLLLCGSSSEATDVLINTGYDPDIYNIAAIIRVCNIKKITIPDGVTEIPGYAFLNCCDLEEVVIPNSVTKIGDAAFSGCSKLTSVNIPDGVTIIGDGTFYNCFGLTSLVIPNSVTTIGANAFSGCNHLGNINIPNGVTVIGEGAFSNCSSFTLITIPDGITVIKSNTFNCCSGLPSITIPNNVKTIEGAAFHNCTGLTSISIPDSVTSLDERAFTNCTGIKNISGNAINAGIVAKQCGGSAFTVTITSGTSVGANAFKNCSGLASVIIGNSILSIENSAFSSCTGLTSVNIPDSVTSIKSYAFSGCRSLISITIPDSVISIGDSAFNACTGLKTINGNATNTAIVASQCGATGYTVNITSGEAITSSTFANLSALKSLNIGSTIESIDVSAFEGCSGLENITVEEGNPHYVSINNNLVETSTKKLLLGSKNSTIPTDGSVTSIGNSAFKGNTKLSAITIPAIVVGIEDNAFSNCSSLTKIVVESPTIQIATNVFNGCNNLQVVTMSYNHVMLLNKSELKTVVLTSCTELGDDAFNGCTKLTNISFPNTVTRIGNQAFASCESLKAISIPNGVTEIGNNAFYHCYKISQLSIPSSVSIIGNHAFDGCTALKSISIENGVTNIKYAAFSGCSALKTITIPDSVTEIGDGLFFGCSSLESLTVPFIGYSIDATEPSTSTLLGYFFGDYFEGGGFTTQHYSANEGTTYYIPLTLDSVTVTKGALLYGAFYGCYNIRTIQLGDAITKIPGSAFSECTALVSVEMPNTLTEIGGYAFSGCTKLLSIDVPDSVTSIGSGAFLSCSGIKSIRANATNASTISKQLSSATYSIDVITGNTIVAQAFRNCSGITSINLPESIMTIGSSAFEGCSALTSINIPSEIKIINDSVFYNCSSLAGVVLPQGIFEIGSSAFYGCINLESINIPNTVTTIGRKAFYACRSLNSMNIPNSVTSIGSEALCNCSGLTSLNLPNSITMIEGSTFSNCSSLTSLTIPDSVVTIESAILSGCSSLVSLTIPFVGNSRNATEPSAKTVFGYLFGTVLINGTRQYWADNSYASEMYNIPSSLSNVTVTGGKIFFGAFYNCSHLTNIVLADDMCACINAKAFYNCTGLKAMSIPNGVVEIDCSAFENCSGLLSVNIGNDVETIDDAAFKNCSGLTNIIWGDSLVCISDEAFCNCTSLTSIATPSTVQYIDYRAFYGCVSSNSLILNDGLKNIDQEAFGNCQTLTSIIIPNSVQFIGSGVLNGCISLTNISVPFVGSAPDVVDASEQKLFGYIFGDTSCSGCVPTTQTYATYDGNTSITYYLPPALTSVTINGGEILSWAFNNCGDLVSVTLPNNLTYINAYTFYGCSGLTSISIPSSVTGISDHAFEKCSSLNDIVLSEGLNSIGWYAFAECSSFKNITIPSSVTYIKQYALSSCPSLQTITILGHSTTIYDNVLYNVPNNLTINAPSEQASNLLQNGALGVCEVVLNITYGGIGNKAFRYNKNVVEVNIDDSISSIGEFAFEGCEHLQKISFGKDINELPQYVLGFCDSLNDIYYSGTTDEWNSISKHTYWASNSGTNGTFIVHCSDGNIVIS